ncbi:hypothetical protein DFJ67_5445 [Asanoa ferruginea]|uniref:Uncharacterized protein n=1 Tax=Asanoa ferruginea TaxID=53367 RepID=A0A3D9ZRA4_9ACTN|nr:hypothetical protein [Asanoa ferruginea]REF99409.1 hypothetical protein DFJ67_5445 [Asanoa ferruginea]GIF46013.1 hypothetical protein Afe04nite_05520 [Asanoa ferruginea]
MCTDAYRAALIQAFLSRESPAPAPESPRQAAEAAREGDAKTRPREAVSS